MFLGDVNQLLLSHHPRWQRAVLLALVLSAFQSAATVLRPIPIKTLIEPAVDTGLLAALESLAGSVGGRIVFWTLVIIGLELTILGARLAAERTIVGMTERVIRSIRGAIIGNLLRGPYRAATAAGPGAVLAAASGDVEAVQRLLREAIVATGVSVLQIALMLVVIVFVEAWLFWFLLAEIALLSAGIAVYATWRKRRYLVKMAIDEALLGYLATIYQRNLDIRFTGLRTMFLARSTAFIRRLFGINTLLWMRHSLYHGVMEFVISISAAICLLVLLLTAGDGPPPIGKFLVFAYYTMLIFPCLGQIGEAWPMVLDARAALARINANTSPAAAALPPPSPAPPATVIDARPAFGPIEFHDVVLLNQRGEPILDRVSFAIQPGDKVGLFGESGAGKTSILMLILGLQEPSSGSVTVSGRDARTLTLADRKRLFFFMRAQAAFLPGTVYDNIALARSPSPPVLDETIRAARLYERLSAEADIRVTAVSDKGEPFSGGEQQRIAIARAFLADPPCLILDEALNSLDEAGEMAITQALCAALTEKTLIVVSHRRSIAQLFAHRIEFIGNGRIVVQRP